MEYKSVTPYVGVWIETAELEDDPLGIIVTPYVGVWIETLLRRRSGDSRMVTPYVGVWIETRLRVFRSTRLRHSLRGSVD